MSTRPPRTKTASAPLCQHCGAGHPPGTAQCPQTLEPMSAAGPCGSTIDRYFVESLLGTGGFGSVYRARHVRTHAPIALKVLRPMLAKDATALDRFMREARATSTIKSDHIVRVLDAEVTKDNVAFIAMELLDGEDLQQLYAREKAIHPTRLIGLVRQALLGLQAAHENNVVHRDMKPANVFVVRRVDSHGRHYELVRLLDFGISKMQSTDGVRLTLAGTTMGTPSYMAYEQFFDARDVDARTDVYSVAAMTFELLSGKKPFDADSLPGLIEKIRTTVAPPLRSVAPALAVPLCAVIDKGLQRKRERRWQSAREFAEALTMLKPILGDPPPLLPRVRRGNGRENHDPQLRIDTQPGIGGEESGPAEIEPTIKRSRAKSRA